MTTQLQKALQAYGEKMGEADADNFYPKPKTWKSKDSAYFIGHKAGFNQAIELMLPLVESLNFYANPNNFENGVINSADIMPATKITGRIVRFHTDYPTEVQAWVGGKLARKALADLRKKVGAE